MELRGRYTIFAEGARGHLTKQLVKHFQLDEGREPQKYGLGLKELWHIAPEKHRPGLIEHSFGWPLDNSTGGGSFLYHYGDNLVALGLVVHLNYKNPNVVYGEFQKFKTHPSIAETSQGGKRLSYGARAITEGGWQKRAESPLPGGCLVGCAAGFVNVPRIKGSHNAIHSGNAVRRHLAKALASGRVHDEITGEYLVKAWRKSKIGRDLWRAMPNLCGRCFSGRPAGILRWFRYVVQYLRLFVIRHHETRQGGPRRHDADKDAPKIDYPKPDGALTFDRLSSVFMSGTNHEENQPSHLLLADPLISD